MKFAFVYDQGEDTPQAEVPPPIPDPQERHARRSPLPSVRIALAARTARTRGLLDFDRTHTRLDRLLYTVSTLDVDPDPTPAWGTGAMDADESFRPQAFRAPTLGGGA